MAVPVTFGPVGEARPADAVLLDGSAEIAAGRCGETIKLNLGDVGYYRVQYECGDAAGAGTFAARDVALRSRQSSGRCLGRLWNRIASRRGVFDLTDSAGGDDHRTVADQSSRISRIDQAERGRAGQAAFHAYARGILRPIFGRLGWDAPAGGRERTRDLRARLVRVLASMAMTPSHGGETPICRTGE